VVVPEDTVIHRGDKVAFYPFNPINEWDCKPKNWKKSHDEKA
jgi:hypothetical protein